MLGPRVKVRRGRHAALGSRWRRRPRRRRGRSAGYAKSATARSSIWRPSTHSWSTSAATRAGSTTRRLGRSSAAYLGSSGKSRCARRTARPRRRTRADDRRRGPNSAAFAKKPIRGGRRTCRAAESDAPVAALEAGRGASTSSSDAPARKTLAATALTYPAGFDVGRGGASVRQGRDRQAAGLWERIDEAAAVEPTWAERAVRRGADAAASPAAQVLLGTAAAAGRKRSKTPCGGWR